MTAEKRPILKLKPVATVRPEPAAAPQRETPFIMFAIYGPNNREHPGRFIVRKWSCTTGKLTPDIAPHSLSYTLRDARLSIPFGLEMITRNEIDDPCVLETWL